MMLDSVATVDGGVADLGVMRSSSLSTTVSALQLAHPHPQPPRVGRRHDIVIGPHGLPGGGGRRR